MSPKACLNEYPPHVCVLDVGHHGPHQAFRTDPNRLAGMPLLMAEWHGGGLIREASPAADRLFAEARRADERHFITTARSMIEVVRALASEQKPLEDDDTVENNIMSACRIAAGVKPAGLDSGIALGIMMEAEAERMKGLAAYMPSAPGALFGINRTEQRCCFPDCKAVLTFESHLIDNTQDIHDKHGLEGAKLRVCRACRDVHGKVTPRQPAIPGVTQHKARPGVSYRIYDNMMRDDALIVAESQENLGWGRMVLVPGQLLHCWKKRTKAPPGEVALTDDDLETIINQFDLKPMHFQPWAPVEEDDAESLREEYHETKAEIFRSDPELMAHVAKQLDIDISNEDFGPRFGEKMRQGIDRAWVLAFETWDTVEHKAMVRAARRASLIMHNRRNEE